MSEFKEEVLEFLKINDLKQSDIARGIHTSSSTVTLVLNNKYGADSESIKNKIKNFMQNYTKKDDLSQFFETLDTKAVKTVVNKTIAENGMCAIYGEAGSGKTWVTKKLCKESSKGVYIEVDAYTTTRGLLKKIADKLDLKTKRAISDTLESFREELMSKDVVIFIDEAEYLTQKTLEVVRRINDFTKTTIVLSGTHDLIKTLYGKDKKEQQLYSRIKRGWELGTLDIKQKYEVIKGIFENYDMSAKENVIKHIYNITKGNFRKSRFLIEEAIDLNKDVTIEVIDMAKRMLLL